MSQVFTPSKPSKSPLWLINTVWSTNFLCPLCDAEYIGLTTRHLFQRIEEQCRSSSSICRYLQQDRDTNPRSLDLAKSFEVLRKCQGKMACPVYEMLLIKKYRPSLNICLLYTSPSPRDLSTSRMPSSA